MILTLACEFRFDLRTICDFVRLSKHDEVNLVNELFMRIYIFLNLILCYLITVLTKISSFFN